MEDMHEMEEKQSKFSDRFSLRSGVERTTEFLNRSVGRESNFSWGLFLLVLFGIYALVNVVVIVIRFFN